MNLDLTQLLMAIGGVNATAWLVLAYFARRIDRSITLRAVEHEMLISDFCERKGIAVADLPTRRTA